MPSLSSILETASDDTKQRKKAPNTEGTVLLAGAIIDVFYSDFNIILGYHKALTIQLSEVQTPTIGRIILEITL